jgi:tRNA/rRNA methyltransferase
MSISKPTIILVKPQMGENIGAAARAMLNFGLTDLRLVSPRDGWPSESAEAMSAGALDKMPPVQVFDSVAEAIADCHHVYATTARPRDMVKPAMPAREAANDMHARAAKEQKTAILFGGERAGLENDDVAHAHTIITLPTNPDFSSLNLGQAVMLCVYEWFQVTPPALSQNEDPLATQKDFEDLMNRLEEELDKGGFFPAPDMKPTTVRNVRNLFTRIEMTDQEVRTFHGMVSALIGKKKR